MKPKQFICFLLLLVSLVARAQYYEFTQESEKFGQEVDSLFQSFRNEGLVLMGSEFKTMWGDGTLNDDQKAIVIDIAVKLHQKHFKLIPHQANFFFRIGQSPSFRRIGLRKSSGLPADDPKGGRCLRPQANSPVLDHHEEFLC